MKNIFIDSNIWLSLYAFSDDDLNQFMKLSDLIGADVNIFLTKQVCDEVNRNRENKINEAMRKFENWKFEVPNICKGYDVYQELKSNINNLKETHNSCLKRIKDDIISKELHADKAIDSIFDKISIIPNTDKLINKAFLRYTMGNPPGKDRSYGDAINWLSLLENVPNEEDLFFIGRDKDFQSVLDANKFNQFLLSEWKQRKKSDLLFYKSLTEFFNNHIKDIQIRNELIADQEKNRLISNLNASGSFSTTHSIVCELSKFNTWTNKQVERILDAVNENPQVGRISGDQDVADFLNSIEQYRTSSSTQDDDLPF